MSLVIACEDFHARLFGSKGWARGPKGWAQGLGPGAQCQGLGPWAQGLGPWAQGRGLGPWSQGLGPWAQAGPKAKAGPRQDLLHPFVQPFPEPRKSPLEACRHSDDGAMLLENGARGNAPVLVTVFHFWGRGDEKDTCKI